MNTALMHITGKFTIREALEKIDLNQQGCIFTTDENGKVCGVATDGDIRRGLLNGLSLDNAVELCANTQFVHAGPGDSREQLLKKLDQKIRVIPVLDAAGTLVDVVTKNRLPGQKEQKVYTRAKAPVRISFGGGGSDLTHYFMQSGGAVINATISLFSHATLHKRDDLRVCIHSHDLQGTLEGENLEEVCRQEGSFGLIQSVLKTIQPDFGFELYLHSDFPMKSGLGGSAVVAAAILGCFNELRIDKWSPYEIAELAYQAERHNLGVAGGWQDQYATIFGGINFMEFRADQNLIHPLKMNADILNELEECLVLCNTGTIHESGAVHDDQRKEMEKADIRTLVDKNVALTYTMRNMLLRGQLKAFAEALHQGWQYKRQFSAAISNPDLDALYDFAMANGALGGKLLGAGGGGFFLFFVPAKAKHQLMTALESKGKKVTPFRFEQEGLRSWQMRDNFGQ
jgi:D-glycero-alpha-D-manno-heptose-7-phosphate kinase